jgi:hypothetical protein
MIVAEVRGRCEVGVARSAGTGRRLAGAGPAGQPAIRRQHSLGQGRADGCGRAGPWRNER